MGCSHLEDDIGDKLSEMWVSLLREFIYLFKLRYITSKQKAKEYK